MCYPFFLVGGGGKKNWGGGLLFVLEVGICMDGFWGLKSETGVVSFYPSTSRGEFDSDFMGPKVFLHRTRTPKHLKRVPTPKITKRSSEFHLGVSPTRPHQHCGFPLVFPLVLLNQEDGFVAACFQARRVSSGGRKQYAHPSASSDLARWDPVKGDSTRNLRYTAMNPKGKPCLRCPFCGCQF